MFLLSLCLNANVGKLRFPSFLFFRFLSPLARSAVHLYGDVRTIEDFPSGSLRPPCSRSFASGFAFRHSRKQKILQLQQSLQFCFHIIGSF